MAMPAQGGMIMPQQVAQPVMMTRQSTGQGSTVDVTKDEKEKKQRDDPHGLYDADVKLNVDNLKPLLVQELPDHGYTGAITKDGFEEDVRGAASADDLAALLVKGLKREALLEIVKTSGAKLSDYESARSTKTGLQKALYRDRLE